MNFVFAFLTISFDFITSIAFGFVRNWVLIVFEHVQPLFPGESSVDQLVEIIKVLITFFFFI